MPRIGFIIDTQDDRARISTSRRGVCDGCSDKSCSFEHSVSNDKPEIVTVINTIDASPGDTVEFDLPGHTELKVSIIVWLVPIVGLIAGAAIGPLLELTVNQDISSLVGAILGFLAAFSLVILYDRHASKDPRLIPIILKVVSPDLCSITPGPSEKKSQ